MNAIIHTTIEHGTLTQALALAVGDDTPTMRPAPPVVVDDAHDTIPAPPPSGVCATHVDVEATVASVDRLALYLANRFSRTCPHDFDDLYQEARLAAVLCLSDWDGAGPFGPFARTCMTRRLIRVRRKLARRGLGGKGPATLEPFEVDGADAEDAPSWADLLGVDADAEDAANVARLRAAVDGLPSQQRTVMTMALEGVRGEDIGIELGLTRARIHQIVDRARTVLRARFAA